MAIPQMAQKQILGVLEFFQNSHLETVRTQFHNSKIQSKTQSAKLYLINIVLKDFHDMHSS